MAGPYPIDKIAAFTQQQKLSPEAAAFIQSQYGGVGSPDVVAPAAPVAPDPSLVVPPAPAPVGPSGIPMGFAAPKPPVPAPAVEPTHVAPGAPPPPAPPGMAPLAPSATATIAPVTVTAGPPKPAPIGGGSPLPLQPPAPPAEGLYKGKDPYSFGLTPGQTKMAAIEGRSLYGQGEYAKQSAEVDSQLAQDYNATAKQIATDADAQEQAALKKAADRKMFLARFNAETEKQINDYTKAEIKPDRLWSGANGTANAITAMIGSFVAGVAGYLDPSKDYVGKFAAQIDQKIQQDIDLQKAQIAKKGAGIEARRGLYGSYLQQFGQEDTADAMAHETYLRKIKAQVDAYASKATSEKAKIQAGALSAAIDDKIALWAAGRQASGEKMIDQYDLYQKQQAANAQAAAMAPYKDEYALNKKGIEASIAATGGFAKYLPPGTQLPNGTVVRNPFGMHVKVDANNNIIDYGTEFAKSKADGGGPVTTVSGFNEKGEPIYGQGTLMGKDPKAFNEAQKAYTMIKKDFKIINDLRDKHGGGAIWNADDIAEANAAAARIQLQLKSPALFQLGVIAGPDKDYLTSQVPDHPLEVKAVGAIGADPIGKQLKSAETFLDDAYKNAEATYVKGGAAKNTGLPLTKPK